MLAVYLKELNTFFSSVIGYLAIMVFLLLVSGFVWIFPGTNVLGYGYSTLEVLFYYAPLVFLFLIPAITMRSFSEELNSGTFELLSTRPIQEWGIILGKYFAALTLVLFSLLPTLVYYASVYMLGSPVGNIDTGATNGSYIGLLLLGSAFVSVGIFASSITKSQIVAFIVAAFLCSTFYVAFDSLSQLDLFYAKVDDVVESIGINAHYVSISKGVLDTRDVLYFASFNIIFLMLTHLSIQSRKW